MLSPIRAVSPRIPSRCPSCHCFVRLDQGTCSACGVVFALAPTVKPLESSSAFSNLQPDGKIKKRKIVEPLDQMNLFQGVL